MKTPSKKVQQVVIQIIPLLDRFTVAEVQGVCELVMYWVTRNSLFDLALYKADEGDERGVR
ncbi:MAG: hypothetical protein MR209_00240 [Veillonellaceae bacterium]|nr:hypothetical protein [Veillonellaceae bacterium]